MGRPCSMDLRERVVASVLVEGLSRRQAAVRFGVVESTAINFTGGDTWVRSLRCLTRGGRLLTCGATAGYDPKEDIRYIWTFDLSIVGSNSWGRGDLLALLKLVEEGKLRPVIDQTLPLAEAREAFRLLQERAVFGKVIVDPWL